MPTFAPKFHPVSHETDPELTKAIENVMNALEKLKMKGWGKLSLTEAKSDLILALLSVQVLEDISTSQDSEFKNILFIEKCMWGFYLATKGIDLYFRTGSKILYPESPTFYKSAKEAKEAAESLGFKVLLTYSILSE